MAVWTIAGVLMVILVPGLLAVRGLGCLLLLGAAVLLDACFLATTPWRYALTLLAFVWAILGAVLVYSPHKGRDLIAFSTTTSRRLAGFAWAGAVYGLGVIVLAIFVYPW